MQRNLSAMASNCWSGDYRGIPAAARHMLPLFRSLPLLLIGWPPQNIARLLTARKGTPHDRTNSAQRPPSRHQLRPHQIRWAASIATSSTNPNMNFALRSELFLVEPIDRRWGWILV